MIFDIVVIALFLISCIIAFFRGFIREVLTILGVGGGLVIAYILGPVLQPLMHNLLGVDPNEQPERLFDIIPHSVIADALAYGSVFIIFVILLSVLSHYLSGSVRAIGLGALDRTLGVIFGMLRAVLILAILYLPLYILVDEDRRSTWFDGSRTQVYVEASAAWLAEFIPESVTEDAEDTAEKAVETMPSKTRSQLEKLKLLGESGEDKTRTTEPEQDKENGPGYENKERQGMENLIEEKLQTD